MTAPVLRSQIGVAKEVTKGTTVAPTAFIPVKSFNPVLKQAKLIDSGWRGSMGDNFGMQNGTRYSEIDIAGDVFVDTFPWLLAGVLGVDTVAGAGPYTHTLQLLNTGDAQPTSLTLTDNEAGLETARSWPGQQVSEVTLKFDAAGLLGFDAKTLGWASAVVAAPTASFSALAPVPSYVCAPTLNALAMPNIQNAEIVIKRLSAEAVMAVGAQDPYKIHLGALEVTTKILYVAADGVPLVDYQTGVTKPLVTTFTQAAGQILKLTMTQHHYDEVKLTRGKAFVELETTGRAIFNATDSAGASGLAPLAAIVTNALATSIYL